MDDTESLSVTILLWKPSSKTKTLTTAKFAKAADEESNLVRVRPEQILLHQLKFLINGYLDVDSQSRVRKMLRKPRATRPNPAATSKPETKDRAKKGRRPRKQSTASSTAAPSPARSRSKRNRKPASDHKTASTRPAPISTRYNLRRR